VKVQLFAASADPLTAVPLASITTSNGGSYLFSNLAAGDYKVFIPPSEFAAGKPLSGWRSIPGDGGDNGIDDNLDENGIDAVDPSRPPASPPPPSTSLPMEPTNSLGEFGGIHSTTTM
jgi:hypothetical protein